MPAGRAALPRGRGRWGERSSSSFAPSPRISPARRRPRRGRSPAGHSVVRQGVRLPRLFQPPPALRRGVLPLPADRGMGPATGSTPAATNDEAASSWTRRNGLSDRADPRRAAYAIPVAARHLPRLVGAEPGADDLSRHQHLSARDAATASPSSIPGRTIAGACRRHRGRHRRPRRAIVLSHTHHDHVGAVPALQAATGAPIAAFGAPAPTGFEPDHTIEDGDAVARLHRDPHARPCRRPSLLRARRRRGVQRGPRDVVVHQRSSARRAATWRIISRACDRLLARDGPAVLRRDTVRRSPSRSHFVARAARASHAPRGRDRGGAALPVAATADASSIRCMASTPRLRGGGRTQRARAPASSWKRRGRAVRDGERLAGGLSRRSSRAAQPPVHTRSRSNRHARPRRARGRATCASQACHPGERSLTRGRGRVPAPAPRPARNSAPLRVRPTRRSAARPRPTDTTKKCASKRIGAAPRRDRAAEVIEGRRGAAARRARVRFPRRVRARRRPRARARATRPHGRRAAASRARRLARRRRAVILGIDRDRREKPAGLA